MMNRLPQVGHETIQTLDTILHGAKLPPSKLGYPSFMCTKRVVLSSGPLELTFESITSVAPTDIVRYESWKQKKEKKLALAAFSTFVCC